MFEKSFVKYARAIWDENERRRMYKLHAAKTVAGGVFFLSLIVFVIIAYAFRSQIEAGDSAALTAVLIIILFICVASVVAVLVAEIVFNVKFSRILRRAPSEGEPPEFVSYRQKMAETKKRTAKAGVIPVLLMVAGFVCLVVMLLADFAINPGSERLTWIGITGIVLLGAFIVAAIIVSVVTTVKSASSENPAETDTEKEEKAIDEAQGREYIPSPKTDADSRMYRYMFPDEELRSEAERIRKKKSVAAFIAIIVFCAAFILVIVLLDAQQDNGGIAINDIIGFAFPGFVTALFISVLLVVLPFAPKLSALKKRQRAELESNPRYAKHLIVFDKYEAFRKGKGRIKYVFAGISLVLGYALAIAFPSLVWSMTCLIPLFAGALLHCKLLLEMRRETFPIEEEIDRDLAEKEKQAGSSSEGDLT